MVHQFFLKDKWFDNDAGFTVIQKEQVVEGKFCNDRRTQDNADWIQNGGKTQYYATYQRLSSGTKEPSLDCLVRDTYTLKTGIITADEPVYI